MQKEKTFRTDLKKFLLLAAPGVFVSVTLIRFGIRQYWIHARMPVEDFPPQSWFYYVPWTVAGLLILVMLNIFLNNVSKKVVITRSYLELHRSRKTYRTLWTDLSFTPPRPDRKRFRVAIISDGHYYERLEEFFFPEFDLLVSVIREAREHSRRTLST